MLGDGDVVDFAVDERYPLVYFALIYLGALQELHLVACAGNQNPVFHKYVDGRNIHWPTVLATYFHSSSGKPVPLRTNGSANARIELTRFLKRASQAFLDDVALSCAAVAEREGPLSLVRLFADSDEEPLDEVLHSLKAPFGTTLRANKRAVQGVEFSKSDMDNAVTFRVMVCEQIGWFCRAAMAYLAPESEPESQSMPGVPIDDPSLLRTRFLGLSEDQRGELLFIVREARGRLTSDAVRMGLIVRDFIWLRPLNKAIDHEGVGVPFQPGGRLGYYFSTIDEQVFEITGLVRRNALLIIDAIAYCDNHTTKSLSLYLPIVQAADRYSLGSMVGSVDENERTGAWTIVAVRPELDRVEEAEIDETMSVYGDAFARQTRSEYDLNSTKFVKRVLSSNLMGVLYSDLWAKSAAAKEADVLKGREEAFSRMFNRWNQYSTQDSRIKEIVDALVNEGKSANPERLTSELRALMRSDERHALTPPISQVRSKATFEQLRAIAGDLDALSMRDPDIVGFSAYQEAVARLREVAE